MKRSSYIQAITELTESEGVFTSAQAMRLGIPRDALSHATKAGRLERICHGAYRLVGSQTSELDRLAAIWKLTDPSKYAHERMSVVDWDGIAIGGTTAASMLGIGDFYLSPYRIYSPARINSRNTSASFGIRNIDRADIVFIDRLPVTRPPRTIFDLVRDHEDHSLIEKVLQDATKADASFDFKRMKELFAGTYGEEKGRLIYDSLLVGAGISSEGDAG